MGIFLEFQNIGKNLLLFKSYFKEFWFKLIYSFCLFIVLFFVCYLYIDVLIYLLAKHLLLNIDSSKFFFSNVSQLFWLYLKISLSISFIISIPFIGFNCILFFFESLTNKQQKYFWFCLLGFFFCYYSFIYFLYNFVIPQILIFFLKFNLESEILTIHFEAKIEEYFNFILEITIFLGVFFFIVIFLIFLNLLEILEDRFIFKYKRHIYIFFFIISLLLSPPDFFLQLLYILFIVIFFECFFFFKLLFKNF